MKMTRSLAVIAAALLSTSAYAQYTDGTVRIGVMNDMSGPYSDDGGIGDVVAARLAVQDFNPAAKGMKVEIVSADHQNRTDIGSSIANVDEIAANSGERQCEEDKPSASRPRHHNNR